jgi:nicotinamidase-related amidase
MRDPRIDLRAMRVRPENAALVVVDWQERLAPAMEAARQESAARGVRILIEAAKLTALPVLVTEQYPRGLGATVEAVAGILPEGSAPIAKTCFACTDSEPFMEQLGALERSTVILAGMETHVCVWQTARNLRERGYSVHVVADAVLSRTAENRAIGLELMRAAGCVITSSEVVAFDLVGGAGHPAFKAISKLVR